MNWPLEIYILFYLFGLFYYFGFIEFCLFALIVKAEVMCLNPLLTLYLQHHFLITTWQILSDSIFFPITEQFNFGAQAESGFLSHDYWATCCTNAKVGTLVIFSQYLQGCLTRKSCSAFRLSCKYLKPYIKLKPFLINHLFFEKLHCWFF